MITISVCMIVKNEEERLARCLGCLKDIADEIVVVDTGSDDRTKDIARNFTDRVYDFRWTGDFSEARNHAFSFATCDYIYSADADEFIDEENRKAFKTLKELLLPEIEIVQMHYVNPADRNMAYNDLDELRPKLFKRLRTFTWIDPIHETIRTLPVVFDSDIRIIHEPHENHAGRDFKAFLKVLSENDGQMSDRLFSMYAKELYFSGGQKDFAAARPYFEKRASVSYGAEYIEALCVTVKAAADSGEDSDIIEFEKDYADYPVRAAEIDHILSQVFSRNGNKEKADKYSALAGTDESYVRLDFGSLKK
ncbi:MAG: glycosyltransferase family 2 protein [Lachnospiraceae bacterium]|nr:glycosyltransferase family 2 protein [Lachnospiraceae bacterium]